MAATEGGDEYLVVARVRRPHGVRGELLIAVDTDRPRHVFRKGRTLHLADARARPTGRTVTVAAMKKTPGGGILTIEGLADRDAADALRGQVLLIEVAEASPAAEGEVHYRHLVGLAAMADGEEIGKVEDILEFPSGVTLLIRGRQKREILVPYVKGLVAAVDLERKVLALELPEGYLELE